MATYEKQRTAEEIEEENRIREREKILQGILKQANIISDAGLKFYEDLYQVYRGAIKKV